MTCEMCKRENVKLTFHHLIPKTVHRRSYFKKKYSRQFLNTHGLNLCNLCHNGLHRLYDEMTLAKQYHTLDLILADQAISKHIEWVRKQKGEKRG